MYRHMLMHQIYFIQRQGQADTISFQQRCEGNESAGEERWKNRNESVVIKLASDSDRSSDTDTAIEPEGL